MFFLAWSSMYRDSVMTPPGTSAAFLVSAGFSAVAAMDTACDREVRACCKGDLTAVGATNASLLQGRTGGGAVGNLGR